MVNKKSLEKFDINNIISDVQESTAKQIASAENEENTLLLTMPNNPIPSTADTKEKIEKEYKSLYLDYEVTKNITTYKQAIKLYQTKKLDQLQFEYLAGLIKEELDEKLKQVNSQLKLLRIHISASMSDRTISFIVSDPYRYFRIYSKNPIYNKELKKQENEQIKVVDMVINNLAISITPKIEKQIHKEMVNKTNSIQRDAEQKKLEYEEKKRQVIDSPMASIKRIFFKKSYQRDLEELDKERKEFMQSLQDGQLTNTKKNSLQKSVDNFKSKKDILTSDAQILSNMLSILTID